jgi:hypothetical protein
MKVKIDKSVGTIHKNNKNQNYQIIEHLKDSRNRTIYKIIFENTETEKIVYGHNINSGKVKDNYAPVVYGVGYLGSANYKDHIK